MKINYYGAVEKRDNAFDVTAIYAHRYYDDDGYDNREDELNTVQFDSLQALIDNAAATVKNYALLDDFYNDLQMKDCCEVCFGDDFIAVTIDFFKGDWSTDIEVKYNVNWNV